MKTSMLILALSVVMASLFTYGCDRKPKTVAVSTDGVNIRFENRGEGKPAIVLVHGWSNNRTIWDAQISHFASRHKVVAVDLPGCGESGNNRQNWTIGAYGEDIATVVRTLGLDQVVLVGFSMGGPVVVETANRIPEKVAGIVLVDALKDIEMMMPPEALAQMEGAFMDLVTNPTREKLAPFFRKNTDESFDRVVAMLSGGPRNGWRESLRDAFRWNNEECVEAVKRLQVPVVAINSDQTPTNVEAFRNHVPSFKAMIIHDVGHVVMWDAPEEFNRLLEESIREFTGG